MLRARRLASTTVGVLAILGCADESVVAPRMLDRVSVVPISGQMAEPSVTPLHANVDTVVSTLAVVGAHTGSQPLAFPTVAERERPTLVVAEAAISAASNGSTSSARNGRYSREQALGFDREVATESCLTEGASTGQWQLRYSGYGCVALTADPSGTALSMQPATAEGEGETHAPLLLGPAYGDQMVMNTRVETVQQLRRNGEPNPWEVAWIVWQYQDDQHFYYFIPKANGWELGKRDPAYPGGQRFLATSAEQKFPLGHSYNVQVTHHGNVFAIAVDGVSIVNFTDSERPYLSGRVALYSEDALIKVRQVSVKSGF